jgi:hypothetical protein
MQRDSEQTVRLVLDAQSERGAALLRIAAALIVAVSATWLLALPYAVPRAVAVAGLVFAILWIGRSLRVTGRTPDPAEHYLELTAGALCLREGTTFERVPWLDIAALSLDEDRLLVRVMRTQGPPLEIEPRYRGVGLHALYEAVTTAWLKARTPQGCAPAGDG